MKELYFKVFALWMKLPEPLRFLLVGGFNTVFSFCVFSTCIFYGLKYDISLVIAYILGVNCSILTMRYFVYQSKKCLIKSYLKGWITYLSTFLVNYVFLYIFVGVLEFPAITMQAVYTLFSPVYIYIMHKYFTF